MSHELDRFGRWQNAENSGWNSLGAGVACRYLLVPAPLIGLGQFIGQLATIGHYSFSRCGELLNVLLSSA
jgi:hypothetical protein